MPEVPQTWKIVIFIVDGVENHCGIDIPGWGLADCSLAGARLIDSSHRSFPKGERLSFEIVVPFPEAGITDAQRPGMLAWPIIAQEKKHRGWHLTPEAPAFVRTLRDTRSKDPDNMNCVEWLWRVLEAAGIKAPDDVLTPKELATWCSVHLKRDADLS